MKFAGLMARAARWLGLGAAVLVLAACGGGGGGECNPVYGSCPGDGGGGGGGGGGTTPVAADLVMVVDTAVLPNDGSRKATVLVTAVDSKRNTVAGVPVTVSVDSGAVATPSGAVTDGSGVLSATVGIGSDTTPRTITVTASSGGLTREATLRVRDAAVSVPSVTIALSTTTITPSTSALATVTVRSADGTPIDGVVVDLETSRGNLATLSQPSVLTNAFGVATVTLQAAAGGASGADDLLASAQLGDKVESKIGFTVANNVPTLSLELSKTTLRASEGAATATATVRDAAGRLVSGAVVNFSAAAGKLAFSAASAVTNASGVATTGVTPLNTSVAAADSVQAAASVAGRAVGASQAVEIVREVGSVALTLSQPQIAAGTATMLRARVLTSAGAPVPAGTVVSFESQYGLVSFAAATALTAADGVAEVSVSPKTLSSSGADVLIATASVGGLPATAAMSANVVATPTATDLVITLSAVTLPNDGSQTALATVTALDGNRNAVAGVPVTISADAGAVVTPNATVTDASGRLTAAIGIGADRSLRTITVTASSGSTVPKTAAIQVFDAAAGPKMPSMRVALSSTTITPAVPATVTVTVLDADDLPMPGVVVALSTARAGLANLSVASALTDATGKATATLSAGSAGISGADELVAVARLGTTSLTGAATFEVANAVPTLSLASETTLRASTSPTTVEATVRDRSGAPVAGVVVRFESESGRLAFTAIEALSGADGKARTRVSPLDAATDGADTIVATAEVDGRSLREPLGVEVIGERGSIVVDLWPTNRVTATEPATVRATVRNASRSRVAGVVVSFATEFGLGRFDATTAVTDASGEASVTLSPSTSSSAGAEIVTARASVGGVSLDGTAVAQIDASLPSSSSVLQLDLSSTSINSAAPANATATLKDPRGNPVSGKVIAFEVRRGLGATNVATALTDAFGQAVVVLSPSSASAAGADEIVASAEYAGGVLTAIKGFQVQATNVTIDVFEATALGGGALSAYAQTPITLTVTGASVTTPVNVSIGSACASEGKATISPAKVSMTTATVTLQYRDNGCGAVRPGDQLQAVVDGTATTRTLSFDIAAPAETSIGFVSAAPETIYLKGSGLTESSIVTFEVRDFAGNPLPGKVVELRLLSGAGGVKMEDRGVESIDPPSADPFTQTSNATGQVSVRVNSGTLPTPVRIHAKIKPNDPSDPVIATVSSNLSVAVGLPSQLNFSLSQGTRNIEGYNIDGTTNTYQIIAADRSGNPVPAGTSINFVTEGGQVQAIRQTEIVDGIARTVANFVSAEPRPVDGRVTITAYALGEESFLDLNGNNAFDAGEPFQDLGNIFKDRNFDGLFDSAVDEFIPLQINNSNACVAPGSPLLLLDASIPSVQGTCSGSWSGAGQVYVRRAIETVLSTSAARPLWLNKSGLTDSCVKRDLQVGPLAGDTVEFTLAGGDVWYGGKSGSLSFIVADANPIRLNPMAAGSEVTAEGLRVGTRVFGGKVPSTTEANSVTVGYEFPDSAVFGESGTVFVTFTSPSGTATTISITVVYDDPSNPAKPSDCP